MSNYAPIQVKTHYSLLRALNKPDKLLAYAKKQEFPAMAITDYGTISGCVNFFKTFKGSDTKPILGVTLYICEKDSTDHSPENRYYSYLTLIAKNLAGWKELIRIVSFSNHPSRFCTDTDKPRLSLADLSQFNLSNLICITGGVGSIVANSMFSNTKIAYNSDPSGVLNSNSDGITILNNLEAMFGKENIFLECANNDAASTLLTKIWRESSLPYRLVASTNSHYIEPQDCFDHRVLLCSRFRCKIQDVNNIAADQDEYTYGRFFISNKYGIPESLDSSFTEYEIKNTLELQSMCEKYDILGKPQLPHFECPNGMTPDDYLRQICREGWKKRIEPRIKKEDYHIYKDRINSELGVLQGAGLSTYFLMLNDLVRYIKSNKWLMGPARGSAGGCLTSYLSDITSIDPIKFDLIFERFYNAGRNTADHIAMPDIDIDIPSAARDIIIDYVRQKYGHDRVAQMMTYSNLKGRQALKEVLGVYGGVSFDVMNQITEPVPDEAKIAGDLQEMKEEEGESSIIKWTLENEADKLREWCWIDEEGNLDGPLAKRFEQAIRLEGTKKAQSKHASGVIVAPVPFQEICPLVYDKSTEGQVAGLEMNDAEALGLVKMDILGINTIDKIQTTQAILRGEKLEY